MSKLKETEKSRHGTVSCLQVSEIKNKVNFIPDMGIKTVKWINEQHKKIDMREKLTVENAINIGMVLYYVRIKNSRDFTSWVESNFEFTVRTAERYILLFTYKDKISNVKNLTEAYSVTYKLITKRKEKEEKQSEKNVADYKKTGVKPKGWRRGTDDKRVKENEAKETSKQKEEKKEGVDLAIDLFISGLSEFISGLANKSFKLVACKEIIKECMRIRDELV